MRFLALCLYLSWRLAGAFPGQSAFEQWAVGSLAVIAGCGLWAAMGEWRDQVLRKAAAS